MYEVADDTYCYPGTTVLKNKLDLTDQQELSALEAEMTNALSDAPLPAGTLDFAHYRALHRHFFEDIYDWAGELRTVRISKGSNMFCYPEQIEAQASKLFAELARNKHLKGLTAKEFAAGSGTLPGRTERDPCLPGRERSGATHFPLSSRRQCRPPSRAQEAGPGPSHGRDDREFRRVRGASRGFDPGPDLLIPHDTRSASPPPRKSSPTRGSLRMREAVSSMRVCPCSRTSP